MQSAMLHVRRDHAVGVSHCHTPGQSAMLHVLAAACQQRGGGVTEQRGPPTARGRCFGSRPPAVFILVVSQQQPTHAGRYTGQLPYHCRLARGDLAGSQAVQQLVGVPATRQVTPLNSTLQVHNLLHSCVHVMMIPRCLSPRPWLALPTCWRRSCCVLLPAVPTLGPIEPTGPTIPTG